MQNETPEAGLTANIPTMTRIQQLQSFMQTYMVEGTDYGLIPGKGTKPSLFKPGAQKLMAEYNLASEIKGVEKEVTPNGGVEYTVTVSLRSKHTGMLEGEGVGFCSSNERKYAKADVAEIQNTVLKMSKKRSLVDAVLDATGASVLFTQDIEDMDSSAFQNDRQGGYTPRTQPSNPTAASYGTPPAQNTQAPADAAPSLDSTCLQCNQGVSWGTDNQNRVIPINNDGTYHRH